MIIEVNIDSWQLDCCGDEFTVGSTVIWKIEALDPAVFPSPYPVFVEDHHDLTEPGTPVTSVTATVTRIYAISDQFVPMGDGRRVINDPRESLEQEVDRAIRFFESPGDYSHSGYRVLLDVPDDTQLPAFVDTPRRRAARHRIQRTMRYFDRQRRKRERG